MTSPNIFERTFRRMTRRRPLSTDYLNTQLNRCLTTFDLTLFGIGNMTGSGIYVLIGTVIRDKAGPASCLSYVLAGLTAFLNAICYAELGSRIPKAGSAYSYTYIAAGEFAAFLIGWSVVLEYVLSVSSVARGWSGIIDSLSNKAVSNVTASYFSPIQWGTHRELPDFLAFLVVILNGLLVATGPRMSVNVNSAITGINVLVIIITMVTMYSMRMESMDDYAPKSHNGFFPFGFAGVVAGAGTSFYSYIGFDAITVSSEEALSPKKSIPIATGISVLFVTVLFVLTSNALTMFVPWWEVDRQAAFTSAMASRHVYWATYVTGAGSLLGISGSLFTSAYAMPRIVYSMAEDGLLPKIFGYVQPTTQVPVVSLFATILLAAILALIFDIATLADFLSIGTLIAYTIVCFNVIILRYRRPEEWVKHAASIAMPIDPSEEKRRDETIAEATWIDEIGTPKDMYRSLPIIGSAPQGHIPIISCLVMTALSSIALTLILVFPTALHSHGSLQFLLSILIVAIMASIWVIGMHHQNKRFDSFKVPWVPVLPCLCIILNVVLIIKLPSMTWLRFGVWLAIGFFIYFWYGVQNSVLNENLTTNSPYGYNTFANELVPAKSSEANIEPAETDNLINTSHLNPPSYQQ